MSFAAPRTQTPAPDDRTGSAIAPPRRRFRIGRGRAGGRYTRLVALMRILLPVSAGVLMMLVAIWPQFHEAPRKFRLDPGTVSTLDGGGQQLLNPRFTGTDRQNRPYNVTADLAVQSPERPEQVDLAFPKADITTIAGAWIALTAERGRFYRESQMLDLEGGVDLLHDSGAELRTASARIDFQSATADGDEPVEGQGPLGTITAQGFRVFDGGRRVLFTGKAKLVVWPQQRNDGAAKRTSRDTEK